MALLKESSNFDCFKNVKNESNHWSIFCGDKKSPLADQNKQSRQKQFLQHLKWSEMKLCLSFLHRQSSSDSSSLPAVKPSPEEAQKWSESFTALMESKHGVALYRAFLKQEFSNENLEFWLAVEDYRSSKPQKLVAKAQKIYDDFVAVEAPKEINLDGKTRMVTLVNVQSNNTNHHVFDRAQRHIQHMMELDSYLRFLQSDFYLELVHPVSGIYLGQVSLNAKDAIRAHCPDLSDAN